MDRRLSGAPRIDRATRHIRASAAEIYAAFVDPGRQSCWLPPEGMAGHFEIFEPWVGGRYRMVLTYLDGDGGKTGAGTDIVEGRFVALEPDRRIVQSADFVSDDPAFAGTMTLTWSIHATASGVEVTVSARDIPRGIAPDDHVAAMVSTLASLAAFVE